MSWREFITLLGAAVAWPPAANRRFGEFLSKAMRRARLWLPIRNQRPKAQNSTPEQRFPSRRKNRLVARINLAIGLPPSHCGP
jgi:hypothetical protein